MTDAYPDHDLDALYRALLLPRTIEEKMLRLIRQGRISKWFSGYGQEAISVGATWAADKQDYLLPMHRNLGLWTTRGVELDPLFCQLMGREGGFTKGRDRTFHFGLPERRIVGMISHLAAMLPVACGLGLAAQLKEERFAALAFVGDGATREGDFHEALNLAAVWNLPVVFIVENNQYGLSTPVQEVPAPANRSGSGSGASNRDPVMSWALATPTIAGTASREAARETAARRDRRIPQFDADGSKSLLVRAERRTGGWRCLRRTPDERPLVRASNRGWLSGAFCTVGRQPPVCDSARSSPPW